MTVDPGHVARLIEEIAAAEIAPRFRRLEAAEIEEKTGPKDLVTAADLAVEAWLTDRLPALLPGSTVVGEEAVARDASLMRRLKGDDPVWIIDPLDGTLNFAEGRPSFSVIVALVQRGAVVAGWIHHVLDGFTITAEAGAGAWREEERLALPEPAALDRMTAALYLGPVRSPDLHARHKAIRNRLGPRSYTGSAGVEYIELAEGRTHYAIFTRLKPWDHAAGTLIFAEAGGVVRLMSGKPYSPLRSKGYLLLAPDEATWQAIDGVFSADD